MNEQVRGVTAVADMAAAEAARAGDAQAAELEGAVHPAAEHDAQREAHDSAHHDSAHHDGAHHDGAHHDARRGDTRARIQQVALELFAEQGYDKTSLREIAERLDVTKAALYYHFKSKEDIVRSLAEDYFGQIDALIAWARSQPRTAGTREEILRRYVRIVADGSDVFRMLHHNQAALASLNSAKRRGELFRERMTGLVDVLIEDHASLRERLRAAMTLGGVSVGWMTFADEVEDRSKLCAAVLDIATKMARGDSGSAPD
jgi:AcrR family transcriptional regulator